MQFDAHVLTQKHNLRQQLSCIDFSDLPLWRSCCLAMTVMVVEGDGDGDGGDDSDGGGG